MFAWFSETHSFRPPRNPPKNRAHLSGWGSLTGPSRLRERDIKKQQCANGRASYGVRACSSTHNSQSSYICFSCMYAYKRVCVYIYIYIFFFYLYLYLFTGCRQCRRPRKLRGHYPRQAAGVENKIPSKCRLTVMPDHTRFQP